MAFSSSGANPAAADVPCRLLLSAWNAEQLAGGARGEGVKRVRVESGANVQLLDKTLPQAFRARDECLLVVVTDDPAQLRAAISGALRRAFAPRSATAAAAAGEERPGTVEVMIPEVACRHLVGARGDRIKWLREEANCDVQLAPGPVAGVAAQRRVRCSGQLSGMVEAAARVHEVLVDFASMGILHPRHFELQPVAVGGGGPEEATANGPARNSRVAVRLLVAKEECGWLIGKRGNKIQKLRELALVSTRDAVAELQEDGSESVVEIFGAPLSKLLCVLQLIVDDLAMMREALPTSRLVLPGHLEAPLRAAAARLPAGAAAHVRRRGETWCTVELEGGERERLAAANLLHEAVERQESGLADAPEEGAAQGAAAGGPEGGAGASAAPAEAAVVTEEGRLPSVEKGEDTAAVLPLSPSGSGGDSQAPGAAASAPRLPLLDEAKAAEAAGGPERNGEPTSPAAGQVEACPAAPEAADTAAPSLLRLLLPDEGTAQSLASAQSGIAARAGVALTASRCGTAGAVLLVEGTPLSGALACFLIQKSLWLEGLRCGA